MSGERGDIRSEKQRTRQKDMCWSDRDPPAMRHRSEKTGAGLDKRMGESSQQMRTKAQQKNWRRMKE